MQIKQCQLIMRMGSGRIEWQRAEAKWRRRPPVIFITCLRFYNCGQHHLLRVKWPLCYQSGNNEECGKWSALWPAQTPPTPGLISSFPPHNFSSLFFFFLCGRFYSVNVRNGDVIKTEDVVVQSHTRASISFHSYFLLLLPSLFFPLFTSASLPSRRFFCFGAKYDPMFIRFLWRFFISTGAVKHDVFFYTSF